MKQSTSNSSTGVSIACRALFRRRTFLLAALIPAFMGTSAHAANYYWDTSGSGTWNVGTNWSTNSTGSPAGTVAPSGTGDTVTFNGSAITSTNEVISFSANGTAGTLTFNNTGTTTLQSSSTSPEILNGATTITIAVGAGAVTIGNAADPLNLTISGSAAWTNNSTANTFTVVNGITSSSATGTQTLTLAGAGSTTLSGAVGNGSAGGTVALTVTSTGVVTLGGANSYSGLTTMGTAGSTLITSGTNSSAGATTLTKGTLQLDNATSAQNGGIATGTLSLSGGTLQSIATGTTSLSNAVSLTATSAVSGSNSITLAGTLTQSASSSLTNGLSAGTLTLSGTDVNIGTATGSGFTLTLAGGGNTNIGSVIEDFSGGQGTTGGKFSITNTGTTTLSGANTYTGLTTLNASGGTLKLGAGGSLNSGNALTVTAGTFDLNGQSQTLGLLTNNGTVTDSASGTTLTIGNGSTGAGSFTGAMNVIWNQGATSSSLTGSFTNTGNLTLNSNGVATTMGITTANNVGSISNNGASTGTTTIGTVGTSVTGVTQNSNSAPLTLTTFNPNATAGANLTSTGTALLKVTNQVANSTGNLTINANAGGNITLTGGANNIGSILNSGSGAGLATIGAIGSSVTSVTENGTSPLALNGTSASSANTTLTAGELEFLTGGSGALGTGNLIISGGTLGGNIAGLGAIGLTSTTTTTTTGTTAIGGNVLTVASTAGLVVGQTVQGVTGGGNNNYITALTGTTITLSTPISGGAAVGIGDVLTFGAVGGENWNSDFTFDGSVGSLTLTAGSGITLNATRTINTTGTGSLSVGAIIGDGGSGYGLIKNGTGILQLLASNTFSGNVTVNAGALEFVGNTSTVLGVGTTVLLNGGSIGRTSLDAGGSPTSIANPITIGASDTVGFFGSNSAENFTGAVTVGAGAAISGDFTPGTARSGGATLAGAISLGGNLSLSTITNGLTLSGLISDSSSSTNDAITITSTTGTKVVTLSNSGNTFDGGVTLTSGSLALVNGSTLSGSAVTKGAVGTGTLTLNGGSIGFTGNSTSGASSINNTLAINGTVEFGGSATNGLATGTGGVSNSAMIFGGAVTVGAGSVLTSPTATGANSTSFNAIPLPLETFTLGGNITIEPSANATFTVADSIGDAVGTSNDGITIGNGTTGGTVIFANNSGNANTYDGGTTVLSGTLQLQPNSLAPSTVFGTFGSTSGALTVNGGTVDLDSTSQSVGNLTGTGGTIINSSASSVSTLSVGNGNTGGGNYAGVIADNAGAGGTVALEKTGTGTITLSGVNTFSGGATIDQGTLNVTGSINNSAVQINSTGVLAGTGSTGAVTLASGGAINLATDGVIGTLTVGGLTTAGGGAMTFEIGGVTTATDKIADSGTISIGGVTTITIDNLGNAAQTLTNATNTYVLVSNVGSATSSDFSLASGSQALDGKSLSLSVSGGVLYLNVSSTGGATNGQYTLATTVTGASLVHANGGTTTLSTTIKNTGSGTQDTLGYSGLTATAGSGTVGAGTNTTGTALAQGATAAADTQTYTAGTSAGTVTVGNSATVNNTTASGTPVATNNGTTINVYSGQSTWNTNGSGSWGTLAGTGTEAFGANWGATQGSPGLDPSFKGVDTATFGAQSVASATVSLNAAAPNVNSITFSSPSTSYTLSQGSGSNSITLSQGSGASLPTINVTGNATAGLQTIAAPVILSNNTTVNTGANQTLNFTNAISGAGSLTNSGTGNTILSNATGNSYSGTFVTAGKLFVNNTSNSGTGTGAVSVSGGMLAGSGTITTGAGISVTSGGSLSSGSIQSGSTVNNTHLTINNTAVTITSANLTFDLGAGGSSDYHDFNAPNTNTTSLTLAGSTSINFGGTDSISLVDLTSGGLGLRLGTAYLLVAAGSNADYLNLVIATGTGPNTVYSLSQNDGSGINGYVVGVAANGYTGGSTINSSDYTTIAISQYAADGVTPLSSVSTNYATPALYLNNGDLEVVPEPSTWALMIGGLALLVVIQRRRKLG